MRRRGPILFVVMPGIVFVVGAMIWRISIYLSSPDNPPEHPAMPPTAAQPAAPEVAQAPPDAGLADLESGKRSAESARASAEATNRAASVDAAIVKTVEPDPEPELIAPKHVALRNQTRPQRARKPTVAALPEDLPQTTPKPQALERVPLEPDEAIRIAVRDARPLLERCYETELKKRALFNGFLVVNLSVTAAGRVTAATVDEATAKEAQVADCIAARLKRLKLPTLTGDAEVTIPIKLEVRGL